MNNNFNTALEQALCDEFDWLDSFDNPYKNYVFSESFENNMKGILGQSEYAYFNIRNLYIRKRMFLILVAALALLITGCAIAHYYITWNETQNDNYGTLDVEFEIDENLPEIDIYFVEPQIPNDYMEADRQQGTTALLLEFNNPDGYIINYSQQTNLAGMGSVSINNETTIFEEITINGYKCYHSEHEGVNMYVWTDGYCLYTLQGTCPNDVLLNVLESIRQES